MPLKDDGFSIAIEFILVEEGGYTPGLPNDPGGETNFGISKRSYPNLNIKALTADMAREIYRRDFWDALKLSELPLKVAVIVLDSAVNQGPQTAIKILQVALGVAADGVLGPTTTKKAWTTTSGPLLQTIAAGRAIRYSIAPNFVTWGPAWMRRLFRIYTIALLLGV